MNKLKKLLLLALVSALFFNCTESTTEPEDETGSYDPNTGELKGPIEKDVTIKEGATVELVDMVYVTSGTLTIEKGVTIKGDGKEALIIMPDAKINAVGTKDAPIVFTSAKSNPAPGDWAGVVIFGKAPVSTADNTQGFEANPDDTFGGTSKTHNSGTLKYVRIEYGGWEVATDKELNGLTLGGVGSGTTIEYVQVHGGKDDAIEWFGGTVGCQHLVVTDYNDDGFDIDEGYQGANQWLLNIQGANSDRGIEAGSKAADPNLITDATFTNMTLVANNKNQAIHVKDNVALEMTKSVLIGKNTPELIKVEGAVSLEQVTGGNTKCAGCFYDGVFDMVATTSNAAATALLEPMFTQAPLSLNTDYSPKNADVKAAEAGAIVGTSLWYQGWTAHIPDYSEQTTDFCQGKGTKVTSAAISADITENTCLMKDVEYEFTEMIYVKNDAVLTIEAGTHFKSEGKTALIIMPGSKIMAEGTADAPIVFTSKKTDPKAGDWAGVVIFGNAPVSTADHTQGFEANPTDIFGGDVADDSSGVLKYVRIEYAGWEVATDKELNGLTLGGVGSKTVIDYVQVHAGKDDAIEWFGGRAGIMHAVVTDYNDDGYDIDEGYQGTNQWLLNIQGAGSDRGIESGSKAADASMITDAAFTNLTIIANSKNQAVHIKDNVALKINKAVIIGDNTASIVKVEGAVSLEKVTDGSTKCTDCFYEGSFNQPVDASGNAAAQALLDPMFTRVSEALNVDYTAKAQDVIDAEAGAVISELWYEGWTANLNNFSGPGDFCNNKGIKVTTAVLSGNITENTCLVNEVTYELDGFVYVQDSVTLTVQAGTIFKSEGKSALIVNPGAKIMAQGTKGAPIVFTSKAASPAAGDWAGVVIFGKAPVSTADHTQGFEANPTDIFGGDVADDSSGVLKYVRIEYAGWEVATDKELNGLTLGGVGSKTVIDYVQVHAGKDDAIEWFGGRAGIMHAVVTDYNDDGYDIDEGYQGTNQWLLNIQGSGSDRGVESGSKAADPAMITNASFTNMTIVANEKNQAFHIKDNVALMVDKLVVIGNNTPNLVKVEGAVSLQQVVDQKTKFTNAFYEGTFQNAVDASGDAAALALLQPMFTKVSEEALNADYSPKAQAVTDAEAGAIVGDDLWYEGWTTHITDYSSPTDFCEGKGVKVTDAVLSGNIDTNTCLVNEVTYEVSGFVYVQDGAALTIQAGTMFKSEGKSALIVNPGAKIMAVGTKAAPIVFTSKAASPAAGDWAGVVVFGKAPVSTADHTQGFEANPEDTFGGDVADDSSGVMKYVRIEYAGWEVATDKELNGLTLGGVGSKTVLDYIQVHAGKDDAIEWFGGRANIMHAVVTDYNDDGYDIDEGYQGSNQYLLNIQGTGSDRGIEAGSKAADPNMITNASFINITIVANSTNQAIHVKDNVALKVDKMVVVGDSTAALIKVEGAVSLEQVTNQTTGFTNSFFDGVFLDTTDASGNPAADAFLKTMFTGVPDALNTDFSAKAQAVIDAEAGAIVGDDLWYEGWTKSGTIE